MLHGFLCSKYDLVPQPEILRFFGNFEVNVTLNDLYDISKAIKPSQRASQKPTS